MKKCLLALVLIAQLSVPAFMVYRYESTLDNGATYRFQVRPYDPYDPFRGRYVNLVFAERSVAYNGDAYLSYGDFAYATITTGEDGNAKLVELFATPPTSGDFLKVKCLWSDNDDKTKQVEFIFKRYYANEKKAPNIEATVTRLSRRGIDESENVTAQVKVKDGLGVIEEIYIGDATIHEYIATEVETK